jgi:hypothetical protein
VGSNPASRTNKIKDLRQKWRESFSFCGTLARLQFRPCSLTRIKSSPGFRRGYRALTDEFTPFQDLKRGVA